MKLCFITLVVSILMFQNITADDNSLTALEVASQPIPQRCDEMLFLLESAANKNYIGESISQLDHALQCAYLAIQSHADDETILAALFHDIGHLCADHDSRAKRNAYGVMNHDEIGADFLRCCGMSEEVCQLVLGHVQAKRYLTTVDPNYRDHLSDASRATLIEQGDAMSQEEARAFEQDPLFNAKILMRIWDEAAKVVDFPVPDLYTYRPLLLKALGYETTLPLGKSWIPATSRTPPQLPASTIP